MHPGVFRRRDALPLRRGSSVRKTRFLPMLLVTWLALALPRITHAACTPSGITLTYPTTFTVKRCWNASDLTLPKQLGGIRFAPNGTALYVIGGADTHASKIY